MGSSCWYRVSAFHLLLFAGKILGLQIFKYCLIFLSLSDNNFVFPFVPLSLSSLLLIISPSTFIPFSLPCPTPASLSIFLVILLCTHYFSRANLFPRMEGTAFLRERNFAPQSCSGQISRQLLIGQDELSCGLFWIEPSSRSRVTWWWSWK